MGQSLIFQLLPVEIVARIANDSALSKSDLMNLRLVSRSFDPWATETLGKIYLSRICISLTRNDLKTLLAICKHPQFGPQVRSIQVNHTQIHPEEVGMMATALSQASRGRNSEEMLKTKEHFNACSQQFLEETEMADLAEAKNYLVRSFSVLKAYNTSISIASADPYRYGTSFEHHRVSKRAWHPSHEQPCLVRLKSSLRILFEAATKSKVHVEGLLISYMAPKTIPDEEEGTLPLVRPDFTQSICSKLEHISIDLDAVFGHHPRVRLKRVLAAAFRIKTFELNLLIDPECNQLILSDDFKFCREILLSLNSSSLSKVELWNIGVSENALLQFLDKHRQTLTHLTMSCCCLVNGSWQHVFGWIHSNLTNLQKLHLRELCTTRGSHPSNTGLQAEVHYGWCWERTIAGSQADIQTGLDELIKGWK